MYVTDDDVTYFNSFGEEYIPKKFKKFSDIVKYKLQVTSYEWRVTSYELRVESLKARVENLKARVEFKNASSNL